MDHDTEAASRRLAEALRGIEGAIAVAVSGGIDSLTLATFAHAERDEVNVFHAVSPAVPGDATARVERLAARQGWQLRVIEAGEFDDANYMANPTNRCFFCKTNLYGAVAARTTSQILSGTNTDDLGEYRPGLDAARDHAVRHPYVEAGIDKPTVRALAAGLGLGALSDLPSAPCLSSRIETGIRIEAPVLAMVHAAEKLVTASLAPRTVRCRVRAQGVVIELDPAALSALDTAGPLREELQSLAAAAGLSVPIAFAPYRTGSAFLRAPT